MTRGTPLQSVILRVGVFALIEILGLSLFPVAIHWAGLLVAAALGTFAAAAIANTIALRIYERGRLADIGLGWNAHSARHLGVGILGGGGAAFIVLALPLLFRAASLRPDPEFPRSFPSLLFVLIVLLFGAVGEELLFRGYGFQVLLKAAGPFATILPTAVLFGLAHAGNPGVNNLGLANTFLWGIVLGFAFVRSGDLWLPIGVHYGWNAVMPLFGVSVSGFTMGMTGYSMHWNVGDLWSGGAYGPEAGLLTTLIIIPLLLFLYRAPVHYETPFLLQDHDPEPADQQV